MSWLFRLGGWTARHPVRVVMGFIVLLLALGGLAGGVGAGFSDGVRLPGTDSQRAADLVRDRFPAQVGDTATLVFTQPTAPGTLNRPGDGGPIAVQQVLDQIRT